MRAKAWALLASSFLVLGGVVAAQPPHDDANVRVVSQAGVTVTLGDVDQYMQRVPEDKRAGFIDSPKRVESMLLNMLRIKQLARQARQMKLDPTLDPDDDGTSPLPWSREEDLARRRLEQFTKGIQIPDLTTLAREVYLTHKQEYFIPEKAEIQQVVISTAKHSDDEARQLAEKVRSLALAQSDDFDRLVEEYSDEPSKAERHGKGEIVVATNSPPEIVEAVTALKEPGAVSPVVRTRAGYCVIKLLNRTPGRQREFDEIKDQLLESLRTQYVDNRRRDFLDELTSQPLDPNPDALAALPARYGVPLDSQPPPTPQKDSAQSAGH
jgi:peptidyl-prolyl cis-trans isomerase C